MIAKFVLALALTAPSFAAVAADVCNVPVCDIAAEVRAVRGRNGDQRGTYAMELKNRYKDSTDVRVLQNIYDLGVQLKALFTADRNEDWVIRAANDLVSTMVIGLAKNSPIDGANLVRLYGQLENQASRYSLITHFQGQLANLEDVRILEQLVIFADGARTRSINAGDEDWVPRAATALINEITIKLTNLDPAHEGLYDVQMTEASLALGTMPFDKVAVLDSSSARNLVVVFMNTRLRVPVYTFNNAEIKGNEISGLFLSSTGISNRVVMTLDRTTGALRGTVESTNADTIEFSGTQRFSTREVFSGRAPRDVTPATIVGTLTGEIAGVPGRLAIRSFQTGVYSATFTGDNGSVVLSFQGKFFPRNAVLSLTSGDRVRLVLALRDARQGQGLEWRGSSFSILTGTSARAYFQARP